MAESRWRWNDREWAALLFFRHLAVDRAGYQLRGVRGWAHLNDAQGEVRAHLYEVLTRLHARGLLDREDVRAPGMVRPVWVYRVNAHGVEVADAHDPKPHRPIPPLRKPDADPGIYLPYRQRGVLPVLRAAYEDPSVPVRFDECGWLSGRELGERVHTANDHRPRGTPMFDVDGTDMRGLIKWGLAERRNDPDRAGVVYWRVTELGRAVKLLDWKTLRAVE